MAIFDLHSPKDFFGLIERKWETYQAKPHKHTEDALFIILGLNHLREWIAPGYKRIKVKGEWVFPEPKSAAQEKSKKIYENPDHIVIRELCNGVKHTDPKHETNVDYGLLVDDWDDVDSVQNFDMGPPSGHTVDGRPLDDIIDAVLNEYREWSSRH